MNVPSTQTPIAVATGSELGRHFVKDASQCLLLVIALFSVLLCSSGRVTKSGLSTVPLEQVSVPVASPSDSTNSDISSESLTTEPPLSNSAPEMAADISADELHTGPALSETKTAHSAPRPSAFPMAYIAAPNSKETARAPENEVFVEKARKDLLVAVAPTLPVERTQRPVVNVERKVEFFSVQSKAQTVAFVVDCSSSMSGAPFDRCRLELIRAIVSLQPDQAFYVIFFSGTPVPLPGSNTNTPQLTQAKSWVKHQTGVRIGSVPIHITGTDPDKALQIAASVNPDVLFLLTDGEFYPPPAESTIQDIISRRIAVNTIAFMSRTGAPYLEQLASKTGGKYRFVPHESHDGLAGQLQQQMATLLINEARTADATELKNIHSALVEFARKDYGALRIADITRSLAPWRQWYLDLVAAQWISLPPRELSAIFAKGTHDEKIAILRVVGKNHIEQLIPECIGGLSESDEEVRQAARNALKDMSGGYNWSADRDVGDPAAIALEVAAWERWQRTRSIVISLSKGKVTELSAAARDISVDRRWAAAIAMGGEQKAPVDWLLIPLTDADALVRDAAVKSLQVKFRQMKSNDLGPELKNQPGHYMIDEILDLLKSPDQTVAISAENALIALASQNDSSPENNLIEAKLGSGADWHKWWIDRKDIHASKELELARKLSNVKNPALQDKTREAVVKRFNHIISHYPGTPSAATAQRLLQNK